MPPRREPHFHHTPPQNSKSRGPGGSCWGHQGLAGNVVRGAGTVLGGQSTVTEQTLCHSAQSSVAVFKFTETHVRALVYGTSQLGLCSVIRDSLGDSRDRAACSILLVRLCVTSTAGETKRTPWMQKQLLFLDGSM